MDKETRKDGKAAGVHERELKFYRDILPGLNNLIKEKNLHNDICIPVPKLFFGKSGSAVASKDAVSQDVIVVLEDLKHLENDSVDKREELDKEHIRVVVKAIAIYHAAASAYMKKEGCPPRGQEWLEKYSHDPTDNIIKSLPSRLKFLRRLGMHSVAEKLEALMSHMKEILKPSLGKNCGPMGTILHGDLQASNMLFHYKGTQVQNVSLVDWQLVGLGHPSYDLIYYIFPHATPDFLQTELKATINLYWQTYSETFQKFGHNLNDECYTFRSFAQEWNSNAMFGAILGLTAIPSLMVGEKELEGFLAKEEPLPKTFENLRKRMCAFMQFCESQGIFDAAVNKHCPEIVPAALSDALWEKVFSTEKGQNASEKMMAIASGNLVSDGMDGYYIDSDGEKIKITVRSGSKPGDGYACETYCIAATFPDGRKQQAFAKLIPQNQVQRGFMKMMGLQEKEVKVYRDLHAEVRKLIAEKGLADHVKVLAPKLVYGKVDETPSAAAPPQLPTDGVPQIVVSLPEDNGEESILVLEDIKEMGFELHDKRIGVSLPCVRMAVTSLAQFHAGGSALLRRSGLGNTPEGFEWLCSMSSDMMQGFLNQMLPSRMSQLRNNGAGSFVDKVEKVLPLVKTFFSSKLGMYGPMETICQGDFWNNNMMFKFDEDRQPKDFLMYDWQLSRIGHPIMELTYYLLANTTGELRKAHLNSILLEYYNTYTATLKKLGYSLDGHSFETFMEEYKKYILFGFAMALLAIPAIMMESGDAKEMMDKMKEEVKPGESFESMMDSFAENMVPEALAKDQLYIRRLLDLVEEVEASGMLDYYMNAEPEISEKVWVEVFRTEKGQTAAKKLDDIATGAIVTEGKDGYYVNDGEDEVKVIVTQGSKPGDGYACKTFCITAIVHGRKLQCFTKVLADSGMMRHFAKTAGIHEKEIKAYNTLHTKVRELLKSKGLSDEIKLLAPRMVYGKLNTSTTVQNGSSPTDGAPAAEPTPEENEEDSILVLEDIKVKGYVMHDKRSGVRLPCVRMAVTALASYHASASVLLRAAGPGKMPEGLEWLCEKQTFDPTDVMKQMLPPRFAHLRELGAVEFADKAEKALSLVKSFFPTEAYGVYGPMETICHGDFWNNNMMFKFDSENQPTDFVMFDWQLPRVGHPAMDLTYYLLANTTGDLRKAHLHTILQEYYTTYKNTLAKLGHPLDGHTFDDFMKEYKHYTVPGLYLALAVIPGIMMQTEDVEDMMEKMKELEGKGDNVADMMDTMTKAIEQTPDAMTKDKLINQRLLDLVDEMEGCGALDDWLNGGLDVSEKAWEEIFRTEKGQTVSEKMDAIANGTLVTEGKDGFYVVDNGKEIKITVTRGSKVGEGFVCDTFIITAADAQGRELSCFAKLLAQSPFQRTFMKAGGLQERELRAYRDLHGAIRDLIREKGLSTDVELSTPKLVYGKLGSSTSSPSEEDESVIVLENIKPKGYELLDKREGVSLPCVRMALRTLAQYHAAASALLRQSGLGTKPPGLEFLFEKWSMDPSEMCLQMLPGRLKLLEIVGEKEFADKALKALPLVGKLHDLESFGTHGPMETVCHGDFWTNNMMFKFGEDKKPTSLLLFDWQVPRIGHPSVDLTYYLLANTTGAFRKAHQTEVLSEYYSIYRSSLEKFGYSLDGHSFETFMNEYTKELARGFMMAFLVIPGVVMRLDDAGEMMKKLEGDVGGGDDSGMNIADMEASLEKSMPLLVQKDEVFRNRLKDLVETVRATGVIDELLEKETNLSEAEWEKIFTTEKGQTIAAKMEDIIEGKLSSPGKDGYYISDDKGNDLKVEVARGSAPGDNYACVVYAIAATRTDGSKIQGFAKVLPDNAVSRMFAKMMMIQDKEIKIYEELHKDLREVITEKGENGRIQIKAPKVLYSRYDPASAALFDPSNAKPALGSDGASSGLSMIMNSTEGPEAVLVMEDLRPLGYRLNDKRAGCNLAHVRMAVKALAHMHACSSALMRKSTTPPKKFGWLALEGIIVNLDVNEMLSKMFPTRLAMLKALGASDFAEKLQKCLPIVASIWDPKTAGTYGPMESILHGDFWNNNMMFTYSENKEPTDIRIVDWQMPRLGHPAADLTYYILTNTTSEFRKENQATVLKEYFEEYNSTLKALGYSLGGYNFEKFMKDWRENLVLGTVSALMALPPVMMQKDDAVEYKEKMSTKEVDTSQGAEDQFINAASDMMESFLSPALLDDPLFKERILGVVADVEATGILDECIARANSQNEEKLSEKFWENLFSTEKGVTISEKLGKIAEGTLKSEGKDFFTAKDESGKEYQVKSERASAAGDNFMSDVFIVTITGAEEFHLSTFVKVLPSHPSLRGFARQAKVHDREVKVYTHVFPYLRKLLKAAHLGGEIQLAVPKVYYTRLDNPTLVSSAEGADGGTSAEMDDLESVIVMENLRERGFKMNDKRLGCDEHHVRAALTALAHYHAAASVFLRKRGYPPRGFEWMMEFNFDPTELYKTMFTSRIELLKKLGFDAFAEKFEKLQVCLPDLLRFDKAGVHGPMETIVHGDFWNNNMLFLYDENNKVLGMKTLDWQVTHPQKPGEDLSNFLVANTLADFRRTGLKPALKSFYSDYKKTLLELGYDLESEGYSEERFFEDWHRSCLRGLIYAIFWVPGYYESSAKVAEGMSVEIESSSIESNLATSMLNGMTGEGDEVKKRIGDLIEEFEDVVDDFLAGKFVME